MLQEIPCILPHWYFKMHFIRCDNISSPKKGFLETCFFSTLSSSYCLSSSFCCKRPFFIAPPSQSCNPGHLHPTCCPSMNHSPALVSQDQTLPSSSYYCKQTQTILEIQGRAASLHPCKPNSKTLAFHLKLMDNLSVMASVGATYTCRHLLTHM